VLLLALTPAAYSSNNTADTPDRRAYISPPQVRLPQLSQRAPCLAMHVSCATRAACLCLAGAG
jgi:hypothetical protein